MEKSHLQQLFLGKGMSVLNTKRIYFHLTLVIIFEEKYIPTLIMECCFLGIHLNPTIFNQGYHLKNFFRNLTLLGEPRCDSHNALYVNIFFLLLVSIQIPKIL